MIRKILILPYFGKLPNYFYYFLESVKANKGFDLLILSDQSISVSASNIKFVSMRWEDMQSLIKAKFSDDICIFNPYKLCDYKPAYGYIFSGYINGYDYWGHCDCDLIFGNLSLLDKYFEMGYEKIGEYGHLIFYKNNDKVNNYFRTLKAPGIPLWNMVTHSPRGICFDEHGGMKILCDKNHIFQTNERLFDDIIFYRKNFFSRRSLCGRESNSRIPIYFEYNKGHLFRHFKLNGKWGKDESLYAHFQKRNMNVDENCREHYFVIPNEFIPAPSFKNEMIKKCYPPVFDKKYLSTMAKYCIKKFLNFFIWRVKRS